MATPALIDINIAAAALATLGGMGGGPAITYWIMKKMAAGLEKQMEEKNAGFAKQMQDKCVTAKLN